MSNKRGNKEFSYYNPSNKFLGDESNPIQAISNWYNDEDKVEAEPQIANTPISPRFIQDPRQRSRYVSPEDDLSNESEWSKLGSRISKWGKGLLGPDDPPPVDTSSSLSSNMLLPKEYLSSQEGPRNRYVSRGKNEADYLSGSSMASNMITADPSELQVAGSGTGHPNMQSQNLLATQAGDGAFVDTEDPSQFDQGYGAGDTTTTVDSSEPTEPTALTGKQKAMIKMGTGLLNSGQDSPVQKAPLAGVQMGRAAFPNLLASSQRPMNPRYTNKGLG
tara:strand:+ start:1233 stop:2060 length:828 start_codon:yes stop_codon:yes gene_type:complete